MLDAGDTVPDITLHDQDGNKVSLRSLDKAVLYFYPKAMTPGCTKEACSFRDGYQEIKDRGYEIYGVSTDPVERQKTFAEKEGLSFPLLADPDGVAVEAFGVKGMTGYAKRKTFIIEDGAVVDAFDGGTAGHAETVLERLQDR